MWYGVECAVDSRGPAETARATFHPSPPRREYVNYLSGRVAPSGRLELAVVTTENAGDFTPGNRA